MYRFEHKISTANASQPGGRLAYAGLSGGFGTLTLGQVWSASYNTVGAITDTSAYFGDSTTSYRHGNALSYAHSTGPVSFQLDLISDGNMDTGQGIDKTEFGVTVGLGDIGQIALAHTNVRDTMVPTPESYRVRDADGPTETEAKMITVHITGAQNTANVADGKLDQAGVDLVQRAGDRYFTTGASASDCETLADDNDATNDCTTATAFVSQTKADDTATTPGGGPITVGPTSEDYHLEGTAVGNVVKTPAGSTFPKYPEGHSRAGQDIRGHKNTHLAVQFNVGGMTPYLGHSTMKENGATAKTKTTHYGVSGGLGDTGINFLVAAKSVKSASGAKSSPWLFNVSKSLGGGATVIFEHQNKDDAMDTKRTRVGLHVSF